MVAVTKITPVLHILDHFLIFLFVKSVQQNIISGLLISHLDQEIVFNTLHKCLDCLQPDMLFSQKVSEGFKSLMSKASSSCP